uniref:DNA mismatch repair proteins mutS family domain-containing protein n=1 Tax=Plectus sambesii TaxID=2011161 RepID=A0A914X4C6_9BILA
MSVALRRATGNSLVIVDEFGKGTMTEVGLSLLTASLNYWLRCGKASCPHVVVSSHLHAVIDLLDDDQNIISYHTMEVLRVGSELEFQFRLVEGTVDCSYAAYTAMKAGIPMHVVERGYDVYQALKTGDPIIKRNTTEIEWGQQYQRLKAVVDFFLAWDLEEDDPIELLEHVASFASVDERNATEPIEEEQVNQEEPEDDEHSSPDQVASSL